MKVQVRGGNCLNYRGDALLLFHHSDIRPLTGSLALLDWRCNATVSLLWKKKEDLLGLGQLTIIATQGKIPTETVILTGLGARKGFDKDLRKEACRLAFAAALKVRARKVAIDGFALGGEHAEGIVNDIQSALVDMEKAEKCSISLFTMDEEHQSTRGRPAGSAGETV
jgi:hypothetical protein